VNYFQKIKLQNLNDAIEKEEISKIYKIIKKLNFLNDDISKIIINLAIKHNNDDLLKYMVKICNDSVYDDEIIKKIIDINEYSSPDYLPDKVMKNEIYLKIIKSKVKEKILKDRPIGGYSNGSKICYLIDREINKEILDEELINFAIENGYYVTSNTSDVIKINKKYIKKILQHAILYPDYRAIESTLEVCEELHYYDIILEYILNNIEILDILNKESYNEKNIKNNYLKSIYSNTKMLKTILNQLDPEKKAHEESEYSIFTRIVDSIDINAIDDELLEIIVNKMPRLHNFEKMNNYDYEIDDIDNTIFKNYDFLHKFLNQGYPKNIYALYDFITRYRRNPEFIREILKREKFDKEKIEEILLDELLEKIKSKDISINYNYEIEQLNKELNKIRQYISFDININVNNFICWIQEYNTNIKLNENNVEVNNEEVIRYLTRLIDKSDDSSVVTNILNSVSYKYLNDEVINLAINKGYYFEYGTSATQYIFEKPERILDIIEKNADIKIIESIINAIKESKLDKYNKQSISDELSEKIIKTGIEKSINRILKLLKENNSDKDDIFSEFNSLYNLFIEEKDYFNNIYENIDTLFQNILDQIIEKGYYLTEYSPEIIKKDTNLILKMLEKNKNNYKCKESILKYSGYDYKSIEYLELLKSSLIKDVIWDPLGSLEEIHKEYCENKINGYDQGYKEKLNKIIEKIGSAVKVYLQTDNLFSNDVLNCFETYETIKIYKYLFLVGKKIDFRTMIQNNELKYFKKLFEEITKNNLDKGLDVEYLYKFYSKYQFYKDIFNNLAKNDLTNEQILFVKRLVNLEYDDLSIDNLSEENLNKKIYEKNKENIYDLQSAKDTVCLLLFNKKYSDILELNYRIIDSRRAKELSKSLENEDMKIILDKYYILLKFVEDEIINCMDYEKISTLANRLNEQFLKDQSLFNQVYSLASDIFENAKTFYGIELNEKLCKFKEDSEIKVNKTYKSTEDENVDYIEIDKKCCFLQHVMNAYSMTTSKFTYFAEISVWKKPLLIGSPQIALSLIDNNDKTLKREINGISNVTVLFNSFSPENLLLMSELDMASKSKKNDISSVYGNHVFFDIVDNVMEKTNEYNEYVTLRENSDGTFLYPCGVKVTGKEPNQYEIDAAAYLGVPLIKVMPVLKKEQQDVVEENQTQSVTKKEELEKIKDYLMNITIEEENIIEKDKKAKK